MKLLASYRSMEKIILLIKNQLTEILNDLGFDSLQYYQNNMNNFLSSAQEPEVTLAM